jgi:hypothetical protein
MTMGRGGARPGAGRPVGSTDSVRRMVQLKEATERAALFLREEGYSEFPGDSVDFLVTCYKNQDLPLPIRLQSAALAAPYERPRLNATALLRKDITSGSEGFGKLMAELESRLALHPPAKRQELITALRNGHDPNE